MDSEDCERLLAQMNCGQKCLLRGLISASKDQNRDVYKESVQKTNNLKGITKGRDLRSTLGQLFNKQMGRMNHQETDKGLNAGLSNVDVAGPSNIASPNQSQKCKMKGKGKYPAKGPIKRKVKEYRLRVVGLRKMCSKAPVGTTRESLMKSVWVRENALAEEVTRKICEAFNWNYDRSTIQYMYANERYLRAANLEDVENADCWDSEAVRVLMGSGCLYVVRKVQEVEHVKVDEGATSDDEDDVHLVPLKESDINMANDLPSKVGYYVAI